MSATVNLTVRTSLQEVKTAGGEDSGGGGMPFTSGTPNGTTYNSGTTPPCSYASKFTLALVSGAVTLDLTAIPDDQNGTFDSTGLKLNFLRLSNPNGNANKISAAQGASNPYRFDGATNWSFVLAPGQSMQAEGDAAGDAVASGHKTIDFAGTGSQTINVHIGLG